MSCRRVGSCSSLPVIRQPIRDGASAARRSTLGRPRRGGIPAALRVMSRPGSSGPARLAVTGQGGVPSGAAARRNRAQLASSGQAAVRRYEARREPGRKSEEAQKPHAGLRRRSRPRRRHRGPVLHQITLAFGRAAQARRAQSQPPASGPMSSTPCAARVIRDCQDYSNASVSIAVTTSAISPCRSSLCPLRADGWSSAEVMTTVRPRLGTT